MNVTGVSRTLHSVIKRGPDSGFQK